MLTIEIFKILLVNMINDLNENKDNEEWYARKEQTISNIAKLFFNLDFISSLIILLIIRENTSLSVSEILQLIKNADNDLGKLHLDKIKKLKEATEKYDNNKLNIYDLGFNTTCR